MSERKSVVHLGRKEQPPVKVSVPGFAVASTWCGSRLEDIAGDTWVAGADMQLLQAPSDRLTEVTCPACLAQWANRGKAVYLFAGQSESLATGLPPPSRMVPRRIFFR